MARCSRKVSQPRSKSMPFLRPCNAGMAEYGIVILDGELNDGSFQIQVCVIPVCARVDYRTHRRSLPLSSSKRNWTSNFVRGVGGGFPLRCRKVCAEK